MENWRRHINEIGMSQAAMGMDDRQYKKATAPLQGRVQDLTAKEIYNIISMIDLTQLTAWPEAAMSINDFRKDPSWWNAGMASLSLLALIPALGKVAKGGKMAALAKKIEKTGDEVAVGLKKIEEPAAVKLANKIDKKSTEISLNFKDKALTSQRVGTRINALNKQLGDFFFRNIKSGKIKANGEEFVVTLSKDSRSMFNLASDTTKQITTPKKVIYKVNPPGTRQLPPGEIIKPSGSWDEAEGVLEVFIHVDPKIVNPDGTISKSVLGDVKDAINQISVHELWHGRQYHRADFGAKNTKDKVADSIRKWDDTAASGYVGDVSDPRYRLQPNEVESWSRQIVPSWQSIRKAKKAGKKIEDTVTRLLKQGGLGHRADALQDHINYLLKQKPCAPVTVANWLSVILVDERGNLRPEAFGTSKRSQKRGFQLMNKIQTLDKNKIIPINPGACGKMLESMHPDVVQILEELNIS